MADLHTSLMAQALMLLWGGGNVRENGKKKESASKFVKHTVAPARGVTH